MTKFLAVIFGLILISIPAMAQVYNGKDQDIKLGMDMAVAQANALYANVAIAGAFEDVKPLDLRYQEMTNAVNEANDRHFIVAVNKLK